MDADYLRDHGAVLELNDGHLRVRNWANATVFGHINRSDDVRLGNVSSFDNGDLKLNIVPCGETKELPDFEDYEAEASA